MAVTASYRLSARNSGSHIITTTIIRSRRKLQLCTKVLVGENTTMYVRSQVQCSLQSSGFGIDREYEGGLLKAKC